MQSTQCYWNGAYDLTFINHDNTVGQSKEKNISFFAHTLCKQSMHKMKIFVFELTVVQTCQPSRHFAGVSQKNKTFLALLDLN